MSVLEWWFFFGGLVLTIAIAAFCVGFYLGVSMKLKDLEEYLKGKVVESDEPARRT
jgi:hypothetical protein